MELARRTLSCGELAPTFSGIPYTSSRVPVDFGVPIDQPPATGPPEQVPCPPEVKAQAQGFLTIRAGPRAVAQLRAEGHEIRDEDVARLSPLKFKNLNVLGRSFAPPSPRQGLLRDPDATEGEDDEGLD